MHLYYSLVVVVSNVVKNKWEFLKVVEASMYPLIVNGPAIPLYDREAMLELV